MKKNKDNKAYIQVLVTIACWSNETHMKTACISKNGTLFSQRYIN